MVAKKSLSHPSPRAPQAQGGWRWPANSRARPLPRASLVQPQAAPRSATDSTKSSIDWLRTLLAKGPAPLQRSHFQMRHTPVHTPQLHLIALDTSGSMRQGGRLAWAKGYAARLIELAARAGDHVALLSFGGQGVQVLLSPGPARAAGTARVRPVGGGGGTPLAAGLAEADRWITQAQRRTGTGTNACLWLLTDGRTLETPPAPRAAARIVVVDFDDPLRPVGRCAAWAQLWHAEHRLPEKPIGVL